MKKLFALFTGLAAFIISNPANAIMINILNVEGTEIKDPQYTYGHPNGYLMQWGIDNRMTLFSTDSLNDLVQLPHNLQTDALISMLEGNYTLTTYNGTVDYQDDRNRMYLANNLHGDIQYSTDTGGFGKEYGGLLWSISPIPNLSSYNISDLYMYNNVDETLDSVHYDVKMWADAEPVPEPSTILLVGVGIGGLFIWRRKKLA